VELILISAMTPERVIGKDRALPWLIPEEYRHFLDTVRGHPIVMGRRSYEIFGADLPESPLIVVSSSLRELPDAEVSPGIGQAIERAGKYGSRVFSAGGATIYRQTMPMATAMYLSFIKEEHDGDTYFPAWDDTEWEITRSEDRGLYEFRIYERRNPPALPAPPRGGVG
jgi:dihydrofolate reductase